MPAPRENSNLGNIRAQMNEVQNLILNGKYSEAVILDKDILNSVIRMEADKACLVSTTLSSDIEQLFENRVINAKTRDICHAIRHYGEQAEIGDAPGAQAANESFALTRDILALFLDYSQRGGRMSQTGNDGRANQGDGARGSRDAYNSRQSAGLRRDYGDTGNGGIPSGGRYARDESDVPSQDSGRIPRTSGRGQGTGARGGYTSSERRGSSSQSSSAIRGVYSSTNSVRESDRNSGKRQSGKSGRSSYSMYQRRGQRRGVRRAGGVINIDLFNVLKFLIPIAIVVLILIVVRVVTGGGKSRVETTAEVEGSSPQFEETEMLPEETQEGGEETFESVEEVTEAQKRWITTDAVRVRTRPTTSGSDVLTVLDSGTEVDYRGDYDTEWIIVNYNGQEAYVSRQYVRSETIS